MLRQVEKGAINQSVVIRILDSSTFLPETGVEHDTAGIALWYRREGGGAREALFAAALDSLTASHVDGGIEHIDDGYYRLDLPDAAVGTGSDGVMVGGKITGTIIEGCYIMLVSYDPHDNSNLGLSCLPEAAVDAAGGLPISDAGGLDMDAILTNTEAIIASVSAITTAGSVPGLR